MEQIVIPLSKRKTVLAVVGSLLFVVAAIFMYTHAETQQTFSPAVAKIVGVVGTIFFSITGVYAAIKLFDKRPGLVIDESGLLENTTIFNFGLIPWEDIDGFETRQVASTRFILIYVKHPESYLARVSGWKCKLAQANMNMYGTPFSIASASLKANFNELERLLNVYYVNFQARSDDSAAI